jgi:hypothetical protein
MYCVEFLLFLSEQSLKHSVENLTLSSTAATRLEDVHIMSAETLDALAKIFFPAFIICIVFHK